MVSKFTRLVVTIVGTFLLAGIIVVLVINGGKGPRENLAADTAPPADASPSPANSGSTGPAPSEAPDSVLLPPLKTNFLIVGKDAGGLLTDVIIVGCFDRQTCEINLLSVPRDTFVIIPPERLRRMKDLGLYPPADGAMKINAVNSYGRETYGMALLEAQLKDLLGVDIQYEIEINFQAFRNIVDDLGGVYFDVPQPGLYYNDPYQDLRIAIPPGFQYLDGANAEGLVRYRATYREGDIQRIGVQQEFLKALFSQVLGRDEILRNAFSISKSIIGYTKTNFSITDIPKYLRYINDISPDKIYFYTLPCTPEYINNISYVVPNGDQIGDLVNNVFYGASPADASELGGGAAETPAPSGISSKGMRIEILNGSGSAGLAGRLQTLLEGEGFTVAGIDTYTGAPMEKTQILVRAEGGGNDLLPYFKDGAVQIMPDMPEGYDIIIITGLSEK